MTDSIDHVIVCLPDLDHAVRDFEERHGVVSVQGGRHAGHGTANRLVPLGDAYVELVAVVDAGEAEDSVFGRWVGGRASRPCADAIAIRTEDISTVAGRLGLEPIAMSRRTAADQELRWRVVGLERTVSDGLPFYIQWDVAPDLHPGRIPVSHPGGDLELTGVTVVGDLETLRSWVGGAAGIEVQDGDSAVRFDLVERRGDDIDLSIAGDRGHD
jgi:hypothetical protein